jgi:hypothetical protein
VNDIVSLIMDYEEGMLDDRDTVALFSQLVSTGQAWQLQGHYGRVATMLIERGIMDQHGNVDWETFEEVV